MPYKETIEDKKIFYKDRNGKMTEWEGFSEVQITDDTNPQVECPYVHFPSMEMLSVELNTSKSVRKFLKVLRKIRNKAERRYRTKKRVKEQSRRATLKWNALHPLENREADKL